MLSRATLQPVLILTTVGLIASGTMFTGTGFVQSESSQSTPAAVTGHEKLSAKPGTSAVPSTNTVVTNAGIHSASITLPGTISSTSVAKPETIPPELFVGTGDPVLTTTLNDASVSSTSTDMGTQTLIHIGSASARHKYHFPLAIPAGSQASVETDGSLAVRTTSDGKLIAGYKTPRAYDAKGQPVETAFSLEGQTLVQTIHFDQNTTFPVVTDTND